MSKIYYLEIDGKRIGYTAFEYADPPMGVVHGKVIFDGIAYPYQFFKDYCLTYNIHLNLDVADERFISTATIPQLKVFLQNGEELLGWGGAITGMESDAFEIEFLGVSSELMQTEFEHHFIKYLESLKKHKH